MLLVMDTKTRLVEVTVAACIMAGAIGHEQCGANVKTAEARAWATVNKLSGGGKKSGSGRKNHELE